MDNPPSYPPEGEYKGMSSRMFWLLVIGAGVLPIVWLGVGAGFLMGWDWLGEWGLEILAATVVFGALSAGLTWWRASRAPRYVRWNRDGIEVAWYRGSPKQFRWEELQRLKDAEDEGDDITWVQTYSGERFCMRSGSRGYEELRAALAAHIWGAQNGSSEG